MRKRILSMALILCMVLTLLPTFALAANTVTVSNYDSLQSVLTSSADGTIVQLGGDISYSNTIITTKNLTLDLNGHTLTYTGTDTEKKLLVIGIRFTGAGLFTVEDSGTDGKFITSETYSALLSNAGSGVLELSDGGLFADKDMTQHWNSPITTSPALATASVVGTPKPTAPDLATPKIRRSRICPVTPQAVSHSTPSGPKTRAITLAARSRTAATQHYPEQASLSRRAAL